MQNRQQIPGLQPFHASWWLFAGITSVLLAHLLFIQPGAPLEPGLDASWAYGLNYTFQHRLVMGQDIFFTFGPLGFLEHTRPLTRDMIALSSWFWFACSICLNLLVLSLGLASASSRRELCVNLLLGLGLLLYTNTHIQRLLLVVYTAVLLHWQTRQSWVLCLASLASAMALLVKFSHGATTLSLLLPYLLLLSCCQRVRYSQVVTAVLVFAAAVLVAWLLVYGSTAGIVGYLRGGLEFSRGSTTAMALNPVHEWLAIVAFHGIVLLALACASITLRQRWWLLPLCFVGPLFIWDKYAFGREDNAHLGFLMSYVFYLLLLLGIAVQRWLAKLACLLAIPVCYLSWVSMHSTETGPPDFEPALAEYPVLIGTSRWDYDVLLNVLGTRSAELMATLQLPARMRETIGNASVDIYPWETIIAAANGLNWTPRPVYQAYITYTPFLDRQNAAFLDGPRAPAFIIWHHHDFADIDNRYPFSSDPLTMAAILQHYRQLQCERDFCLWQRSPEPLLSVIPDDRHSEVHWNEWIPAPSLAGDVLRLHVDSRRTLAGKLNLALWKEGDIEIDYRLRDGEVRTHRLVLDNAPSGIWVSPYLDSLVTANKPRPVALTDVQSLLGLPPAAGYIEGTEQGADGLRIWGWGILPFQPSATQQLSLLLYNNDRAYLVPVENRARPGITQYFIEQGQLLPETPVNLDTCGFDERFNHLDLMPAEYRVRFLVENGGLRAISGEQNMKVSVVHDSNPHNVDAVRLRAARPWVFEQSLDVHWSSLVFDGGHPW